MADDIAQWWDSLSPDTRRRLAEDPHGYVPADLIPEVVKAGHLAAAAYFPETSPGPYGFPLTQPVQDWIEAHPGE